MHLIEYQSCQPGYFRQENTLLSSSAAKPCGAVAGWKKVVYAKREVTASQAWVYIRARLIIMINKRMFLKLWSKGFAILALFSLTLSEA